MMCLFYGLEGPSGPRVTGRKKAHILTNYCFSVCDCWKSTLLTCFVPNIRISTIAPANRAPRRNDADLTADGIRILKR